MSGHSKWSTIKRQKGIADQRRGMAFTKLANAITIAVKQGGSGDPETNPRLRVVLEAARNANMPKDNIVRAIDRGLGKLPGQNLEEITFEGFGPAKTAFLVEAVTDNKARTTQEIRNFFERVGGNLTGQGSVSYMFGKTGGLKVKGKGGSWEDEILELIDLGAEDVEDYIEDDIRKYLVYTESSEVNTMSNKIAQAGYEVESKEIVFKPNTLVGIKDRETAQQVMDFTAKLEEHDDVQRVSANFDIPEDLLG